MSTLTFNDKALLLRAARIIRAEAETIKRSNEPWIGQDGRAQKRRYDRYLREERDLRELAKKAEHALVVP